MYTEVLKVVTSAPKPLWSSQGKWHLEPQRKEPRLSPWVIGSLNTSLRKGTVGNFSVAMKLFRAAFLTLGIHESLIHVFVSKRVQRALKMNFVVPSVASASVVSM